MVCRFIYSEICDFGYPQLTDQDSLKLYITTESIKSEKAIAEAAQKIAIQATGAVSWRRPDIKYRKNEVFVDVIESVNLITSAKGNILRSDVSGSVMMRCYLSGMPECKFGLNDKLLLEKDAETAPAKTRVTVDLDDCQFHQCVKLTNFNTERTITFIPPGNLFSYLDGEFELMKYRSTENINLPFKVHAAVTEASPTLVEYKVVCKSQFSSKMHAQNVLIRFNQRFIL